MPHAVVFDCGLHAVEQLDSHPTDRLVHDSNTRTTLRIECLARPDELAFANSWFCYSTLEQLKGGVCANMDAEPDGCPATGAGTATAVMATELTVPLLDYTCPVEAVTFVRRRSS